MYDTGIQQDLQERQFQESIRQFDAQQKAAAAAAAAYNFGGGGGTTAATPGAARVEKNARGGFDFFDGIGKAINAAQYSQLTGRGYREVLQQLASEGDANAKVALQYVGNDGKFGSAPESARAALQAVGAIGNYATAQAPTAQTAAKKSMQSTSTAPNTNFVTLGNFK